MPALYFPQGEQAPDVNVRRLFPRRGDPGLYARAPLVPAVAILREVFPESRGSHSGHREQAIHLLPQALCPLQLRGGGPCSSGFRRGTTPPALSGSC